MNDTKMYPTEERARRKALIQFNNACQRCGRTAWSLTLEAKMELGPKRGDPSRKELVCGECAYKKDRQAADLARKRRRSA